MCKIHSIDDERRARLKRSTNNPARKFGENTMGGSFRPIGQIAFELVEKLRR
jgi:hypothetical protein